VLLLTKNASPSRGGQQKSWLSERSVHSVGHRSLRKTAISTTANRTITAMRSRKDKATFSPCRCHRPPSPAAARRSHLQQDVARQGAAWTGGRGCVTLRGQSFSGTRASERVVGQSWGGQILVAYAQGTPSPCLALSGEVPWCLQRLQARRDMGAFR
jgi:hypothetical protein